MELRISEPTSWIRHWFLLLCHNVNIFGINNVLIDLHPVVPKESSSVFPAPLRSVRCPKYPSSPAERSKISAKHHLVSGAVQPVPHRYPQSPQQEQGQKVGEHTAQKAVRRHAPEPRARQPEQGAGRARGDMALLQTASASSLSPSRSQKVPALGHVVGFFKGSWRPKQLILRR